MVRLPKRVELPSYFYNIGSLKYFADLLRSKHRVPACLSRYLIVAEFPRSGGSWLCSVLASAINSISVKQVFTHPISMHEYVIELDKLRGISDIKDALFHSPPHSTIVKTHHPYSSHFQRVVCLHRDPVQSLKSHYSMLANSGLINPKSFSPLQFVESKWFGCDAYNYFYKSYLIRSTLGSRIMFIDYDQLLANPLKILSSILSCLTTSCLPHDQLSTLIESSSLDKYKSLEYAYLEYDLRFYLRGGSHFRNIGFTSSMIKWDENVEEYIRKHTSLTYGIFVQACKDVTARGHLLL